ncbi:MAG TPA: ArsR family transcriptional regulator [Pyrinomonadaceae bacterium]
MKSAKLSKRFFESTRGRIVSYLRGSQGTVNDLAAHLDLTDNAVRAHLATLERDGLIKQSGLKKGSRKPHFAYELTAEGEHLFPKAYDALLNQFISVLKERLSPKVLAEALRAVGRSLAANKKKEGKQKLEQRVQTAIRTLEELGGSPRVEEHDRQLSITSRNCPLAAVVAEHPETCQMVETLISELVDVKVVEECDRNETPKCRFVLPAH